MIWFPDLASAWTSQGGRQNLLRQNLMQHFSSNIRQPILAAVVQESQAFVIHTQQMHHGGVQIVDSDRIDDGLVANLIGLTEACSTLMPAPAIQAMKP